MKNRRGTTVEEQQDAPEHGHGSSDGGRGDESARESNAKHSFNHLYSENETRVTKRRTTVRTNTYATDFSGAYAT